MSRQPTTFYSDRERLFYELKKINFEDDSVEEIIEDDYTEESSPWFYE